MLADQIDIRWSGQGFIAESCPLKRGITGHCALIHVECRYGLTEVRVPEKCPMADKDFGEVSITKNRIETEPEQP